MNEAKSGAVVLSKSGRDSGRYFVVVRIVNDDYVYIVDGELRKLEKPKLKKVKHLKFTGDVLEGIAAKLSEGKQIFDSEIRSAVRKYAEKIGG